MEKKKMGKEIKKLVSSGVLYSIRAAEESLARQESKEMEDSLPPGHPLKAEIEQIKAAMGGGDLSDLPAGHPLLRQLQMAKDAYIRIQTQEADKQKQQSGIEIRKAKKLKEQKVRQAQQTQVRQQEEATNEKQISADMINQRIDDVLLPVRRLYEAIQSKEELFGEDSLNRARLLRLRRLLYAVEQGINASRIGRITNA
jgi:hypothetical protein